MIPNILHDSITIKSLLGNTAYGETYSTQSNVKCYFEAGFKRVVNANGEDITASGTVILSPSIAVSIGAFITHDSNNYEVVDVQKINLNGKLNHQELILSSIGAA